MQGSDGKEYQSGVFDVMLYYSDGDEELQATIRDAKVQLLAPIASDSWAQNAQDAQTSKTMGVWKDASHSSAITEASADPMDKTKVYASKRAAKKRLRGSCGDDIPLLRRRLLRHPRRIQVKRSSARHPGALPPAPAATTRIHGIIVLR